MLLNRKTLLLQGQRPRRTLKVRPGDILITRRANQQRIAALVLNYRLTGLRFRDHQTTGLRPSSKA